MCLEANRQSEMAVVWSLSNSPGMHLPKRTIWRARQRMDKVIRGRLVGPCPRDEP